MAYTSKKLIAENIKKHLRDYREMYESTAEASRQEAMRQLEPGQTVPKRGLIYGDAYRTAFKQNAAQIYDRALGELDEWRKSISRQKTDAPSEEALRAIQIFQMRDPKTMTKSEFEQEAQALADRYGDCYLAYRTIQDIASKGEVYIRPHSFAADVEAFEMVEKGIIGFMNSAEALAGKGPSTGKEAFFSKMLDEAMGAGDESAQE